MNIDAFGLENKVCVVSGAGGGIGKSIAHRLAEVGAKVAIIDNNAAAGDAAAPAGWPAPPLAAAFPSTASVIEFGNFFGVSMRPRTGRTMRRWAK